MEYNSTIRANIISLPDVSLTPTTDQIINMSFSTFLKNTYTSLKTGYELGISNTEFLKFNSNTRIYCAIYTETTYSIGFADANISSVLTAIDLMNVVKGAFDNAVNSINTELGGNVLGTINSNEVGRERSRVYVKNGYVNDNFVCVNIWYFGGFTFDIYPLINSGVNKDNIIDYQIDFTIDFAKIKPSSELETTAFYNLGCAFADAIDPKNYTV